MYVMNIYRVTFDLLDDYAEGGPRVFVRAEPVEVRTVVAPDFETVLRMGRELEGTIRADTLHTYKRCRVRDIKLQHQGAIVYMPPKSRDELDREYEQDSAARSFGSDGV